MRKQVLIRLVITWGWSSSLHRACWSLYLFASYQPAWTFVFRFTMRLLYYCSVNWVSASSLLMVFPSITMGFSSSSSLSSAHEVDASKNWYQLHFHFLQLKQVVLMQMLCDWVTWPVLQWDSLQYFHPHIWFIPFVVIAQFTSASLCTLWWPWWMLLWSTLNCRRVLLRRLGIV